MFNKLILTFSILMMGNTVFGKTNIETELTKVTRFFSNTEEKKINSVSLIGSTLPVCMCASLNIGYAYSESVTFGINHYQGGLPMMMSGKESGIFSRFYPFENNIVITTRLGWAASSVHGNLNNHSGQSYGIDFGNQWFYKSGFTQGFTWLGFDKYIKGSSVTLPHGLRYEIGYQF